MTSTDDTTRLSDLENSYLVEWVIRLWAELNDESSISSPYDISTLNKVKYKIWGAWYVAASYVEDQSLAEELNFLTDLLINQRDVYTTYIDESDVRL